MTDEIDDADPVTDADDLAVLVEFLKDLANLLL